MADSPDHPRPGSIRTEPLSPGGSALLPSPLRELLPPPADPNSEREFFDPQRWNADVFPQRHFDERDPVAHNIGKLEGRAPALLILSDFHLADGSAGGDDFLDSHILPDDTLGVHIGFTPAGNSRDRLFAAIVTFVLQRLGLQRGRPAQLDLVLNGDVINFLELEGRGGQFVSPKHAGLFRTLSILRDYATIHWLRGNHDYVVPTGPWKRGNFYTNPQLQVLAEHGDFWDPENWPPGPGNNGSRLVIEAAAAIEVHASIVDDSTRYLLSGIDNLRPWNDDTLQRFLKRRSRLSDFAWLAALVSRLHVIGAADDQAAYQGALKRRRQYPDWLMVQGHTHVPAFAPGVYYNTGTWIATLLEQEQESHVEIFPFLLIYQGKQGQRVEEYYTADYPAPGAPPRLFRHSSQSITALRHTLGYKEPIP